MPYRGEKGHYMGCSVQPPGEAGGQGSLAPVHRRSTELRAQRNRIPPYRWSAPKRDSGGLAARVDTTPVAKGPTGPGKGMEEALGGLVCRLRGRQWGLRPGTST